MQDLSDPAWDPTPRSYLLSRESGCGVLRRQAGRLEEGRAGSSGGEAPPIELRKGCGGARMPTPPLGRRAPCAHHGRAWTAPMAATIAIAWGGECLSYLGWGPAWSAYRGTPQAEPDAPRQRPLRSGTAAYRHPEGPDYPMTQARPETCPLASRPMRSGSSGATRSRSHPGIWAYRTSRGAPWTP